MAPRWLARAQEGRKADAEVGWREAAIQLPVSAPSLWDNLLTSEKLTIANQGAKSLRVDQLLNHFPVALLSGGKAAPANQ